MEKKRVGTSGITVEGAVSVLRPASELYAFWRQLDNLPRFMTAIESVRLLDDRRSSWTAAYTGGKHLAWETEVLEDRPLEMISWASLAGSEVATSGSVQFREAPPGRGTEVRLAFRLDLPSDTFRDWLAKIFSEDPARQVQEDLYRFRQLMETGEVATIEGQPRGRS